MTAQTSKESDQLKSFVACNSFIKYYNNVEGLVDYYQMNKINQSKK